MYSARKPPMAESVTLHTFAIVASHILSFLFHVEVKSTPGWDSVPSVDSTLLRWEAWGKMGGLV